MVIEASFCKGLGHIAEVGRARFSVIRMYDGLYPHIDDFFSLLVNLRSGTLLVEV